MSSTRLLLAALLLVSTPLAAQTPPFSGIPTNASISEPSGEKSPTTARLIGIFPGAGHMYAGETKHGFGYLGGIIGILVVATALSVGDCVDELYGSVAPDCGNEALGTAAGIAAGGVWGWSIYDAGRAARRTNAKRRSGSASVTLEPTRIAIGDHRDRGGIRIGLSITAR